ncbi:MAG TPA: hypothetical protein VLX92_11115 [Kofleriaceae bacterium]|nr:hypothetical protein [Kofleriaceae bacterium]
MALVFLFALASVAVMLAATAGLTLATGFALVCFVALATGVFVGTLVQAKHWENEG